MPARTGEVDRAHQAATRTAIDEIAGFLQETLGQSLVAHMTAQASPKTVGRWARGERQPRSDAEKKLRVAFQVFQLLTSRESAHTARAWFIGLNPQLGDEAPAEAIREGRLKEVWVAAKSYIAGG